MASNSQPKLFFPHEVSSIRTKKDIEATCKLLLTNTVESFELIGEPNIRFISYNISSHEGNYQNGYVSYPIWEQDVQLTYNGDTNLYHLRFHEVDQSLYIYHILPFDREVPCRFIGRKYVVSKDGKRIKTVYDDNFLATPKQAMHKLAEQMSDAKWSEIYRAEPKILENGRAIWLITCAYDWKYVLNVVNNPLQPAKYQSANAWSGTFGVHPMNKPYDKLQDPVIGKDYLAFDYQHRCVRHVANLVALRFDGEGFTPIRLSQAKLPPLNLSGTEYLQYL